MTNQVTIIGNLGGDPELRYTPSGKAVASFVIADTPRHLNSSTNQWEDGETLWQRGEVWGTDAENLKESATKGTRVVAVGRLAQRKYTDKKTNEERTIVELKVDEIAVSVKYATAQVTKKSSGSYASNSAPAATNTRPAAVNAPSDDDTPF